MGFTTGFTGGVTLTLSLAYLTVVTHQANRQRQSDVLRANTNVLRALAQSDPIAVARLAGAGASTSASASTDLATLATPADLSAAAAAQELYYPSKPLPSQQPRPSFTEDLKTRWNTEIEGAVRKVQTTDWVTVRENAENVLANLWGKAFGGSEGTPEAATAAVKERVQSVTDAVKAEAKSFQSGVAAAASDAAAAAKGAARQAVDKGKEVLAAESSAAAAAAVAKSAASATSAASGKKSDVELALQKRYAKAEDERMKKSVSELLDERYKHKA